MKHHQNYSKTHQRRKVSPLRMNLAHGVPLADYEHGDHHLWWPDHTFVIKHHQNYSNQSTPKSVTTAYEFGTWDPYSRWSTWSSSYMMTWPYFCYETPSKTTVTHQRRKVSPLRMNLAHGIPIADDQHGHHHIWWPDHTFVMKHHQKQQ